MTDELKMRVNYSALRTQEESYGDSWEDIFDPSLSLPANLINILKQTVFLPQDFYDIIVAYYMLPSALARVVPYLFFYGTSGSGKSTLAKMAAKLHGVSINSSGDTFAAIRNSLDERKWATIQVASDDPKYPVDFAYTEINTCMVWDDIDPGVFSSKPDLYRLFKFGYDRSSDKITISSDTPGKNMEFRCFCPKIFSSIHPFHSIPETSELARRLLVIPTKRVEDLSDNQKARLGITESNWESKLIDIDVIDWRGFSDEYRYFWDADASSLYMTMKREIARSLRGLKSHQKNLCLDLVTTGITCGIWDDVRTARDRLKTYFAWLDADTKDTSDNLLQLLEKYVQQEEKNAKAAKMPPSIYNTNLKTTVENYYSQGWTLDRPNAKSIKNSMAALGYRLVQGRWVKR